jgi:uncharacterized protein
MRPCLAPVFFVSVMLAVSSVPVAAFAQLSSPMGSAPAKPTTGPGVHSPNSPIAPLQERADVVPWSVLTSIKTKFVKNRVVPVYPADVQALSQKNQRIQGFMMPLQPGEMQKHFLLSSVPMSCSFCVPGGPESMVEVKTKKPVKYSLEVVVVEGKFEVLTDDPHGLYYRISDATSVK